MIHVEPVEPDDDLWREWCTRAARETAALISGSQKTIKEDLYKEGRDWIFRLFHGKCAYCEVRLDESQRYGDLDHFRPKKRVTDEHGKIVFVKGSAHPGYFWLAYGWTNLLPSCLGCNRPGTGPDGLKSGKWDKFPIAGLYAVTDRDDLKREKPWLLNPYEDNPDDHLEFDFLTGIVGPKTPRGKKTIGMLGLNREGLVDARIRTMNTVRSLWGEYTEAVARLESSRADEKEPFITEYQKGIAPFSAIARAFIRRGTEELQARVIQRSALTPSSP